METVRNGRLDNICESINEERTRVNEAKTEEISLIQAALKVMQSRNIQAYRHGGVELARVPGGEKLRVRLVKAQDDAEVGGGEAADAGDTDFVRGEQGLEAGDGQAEA